MALKAAFNWDHLAGVNLIPGATSGYGTYQLAAWLDLYGNGYTPYAYIPSVGNSLISIDSNGWFSLSTPASSTPYLGALEIPWGMFLDNTKTESWIGFRFKATSNLFTGAGNFVWLASVNGAGPTTLITLASLATWGCVLGKEYYFELRFWKNGANYQVDVWMDGVLKSTGSTSIGSVSGMPSNFIWFGSATQTTASVVTTFLFRDFYFLDADGLGNWDSTRVGPIRTTPLPISSVSAPNYSAGTAALTGGAALSSAQSKFGGSSLLVTGANDYALVQDSVALKFTGDFTIEYFAYLNASSNGMVYSKGPTTSRIQVYQGNLVVYSDQSVSGTPLVSSAAGKIILNQMQHHAIVKQGNVWTIYIDGQSVGTVTSAGQTLGNNTNSAYLGNYAALGFPLNGYLDEFRISNVARYTGNFTPPASAFTPDANTVMLLHCDQALAGFMRDEAPSPQSVLQTLMANGVPATTPNITNAATLDPLKISFSTSGIVAGSKILAMKYQHAVMNQQSGNGVINPSLVEGQSTLSLTQETFTDATMRYSRSIGYVKTAPDGSALTLSNIAATQLVLTPTSV